MASNNKLTIIIDVNAKDAKTGIKGVVGDLSSVEKQADKTGGALDRMMSTLKPGAISALGFNEIAEALGRISSYVGYIVSLQQQWSNLNARIKVATKSQEVANESMDRLKEIALAAHAPLGNVGDMFARLALNVKRPTDELLDFTQAITDSMLVASTKPEEAAGAILQLSQALASGTLRGDEFNSVAEQMPLVLTAIEKATGASRAELRDMAEDGELTADLVIKAVLAMKDEWRDMAEQMPVSVGKAAEDVKTQFASIVGESGAIKAVAETASEGLQLLAENMDTVLSTLSVAAQGFAVVMTAHYTPALIQAAAAQKAKIATALQAAQAEKAAQLAVLESARAEAKRTAATLAELQAQRALAAEAAIYGPQRAALERELTAAKTAHAAATAKLTAAENAYAASASRIRKIGGALLSFMGGWPGVIAGAVTAIGLWRLSADDAALSTEDWTAKMLSLNNEHEKLKQHQIDQEIRKTTASIKEMEKALKDAPGLLDVLSGEGRDRKEIVLLLGDARRYLRALKDQKKAMNEAAVAATQSSKQQIAAEAARAAAIIQSVNTAISEYDKLKKAADSLKKKNEDLRKEFADFAKELAAPKPISTGSAYLDSLNALRDIENLINSGDFDTAIKRSKQLKEELSNMADGGSYLDKLNAQRFAKQLSELVDKATKNQELVADKSVADAKKKVAKLAKELESLSVVDVSFTEDPTSVEAVKKNAKALRKQLADILSSIPVSYAGANSAGGPVGAYASGGAVRLRPGLIRGPGTPTSDSIHAYVSRDEHAFITRASRAKKLWPLLNQLNFGSDRFVDSVLDAVRGLRLAQGGQLAAPSLVQRLEIPRLATGGAVSNSATQLATDTINLNLRIGSRPARQVSGSRESIRGLVDDLQALGAALEAG